MILVSTGCSDFDRRTQFSTTYTNRVVLDSNNTKVGVEHDVLSDTLLVDFFKTVENHNSKESKIESVMLESVSLEIDKFKSKGNVNFNFLSDFEIYLKGKGMDEILIGKSDSIPKSARYFEVKVVPEGEDFLDLIKTEEFQCRLKFNTNTQYQDSTMVIMITPSYLVDTKKFGI